VYTLKTLEKVGNISLSQSYFEAIQSFGCYFSTLYGQTEYCPVITQHHLTDKIEDICYTIGQPLSQTEVSIQTIETRKIL